MNEKKMDEKETQKKKADSWLTTAVFIIIAVSFVATSIQKRGGKGLFSFRSPVIVTVGDYDMRQDEFEKEFTREFSRFVSLYPGLERHKDPRIQKEVVRRVKESVLLNKVVELELEKLGVRVSAEFIKDELKKDPTFADKDGNIDGERFDEYLKKLGMTERDFIEMRKKEVARIRFFQALQSQVALPKVLVDLALKGVFQRRFGAYRFVGNKEVSAPKPASEADLKKLYEQKTWVAPEYRKFSLMRLSPRHLAKGMTVSSEEIENAYQKYKESGKTEPLAQVRETLKETLLHDKARQKIATLLGEIDNEIGAGRSLAEIAKKFGLPLIKGNSDSSGNGENGTLVPELAFSELDKDEAKALQKAVLRKLFSAKLGNDPELRQLPSLESCFLVVEKVTPQKPLSFERARSRLVRAWEEQSRIAAVFARAKKIAAQSARSKNGWSVIPGTMRKEVEKKDAGQESIPDIVKRALFLLSPSGTTIVPAEGGVFVVHLDRIEQPDVNAVSDQDRQSIEQMMLREIREVFHQSYLQTLKDGYFSPEEENKAFIDEFSKSLFSQGGGS